MILSGKVAHPREFFEEVYQGAAEKLRPYVSPENLAVCGLLTISYMALGKFGLLIAIPHPGVTALWLPSGLCLAMVLLRGTRVVPGIFAGAFLLSLANADSMLIATGIGLGNTYEALLGAYLVNRYAHGIKAFFEPRDVLRFVLLAGLVPTALCATIGVGSLCTGGLSNWAEIRQVWLVWWVGDILGVLLLTPFLVLLLGHKHHSMGKGELLEMTALAIGVCVVGIMSFGPPTQSWMMRGGMPYLTAPFLVWAAVRFCPLEASGAALIVSGFALWGSLHGYGLYANTRNAPLLIFGYLAVLSSMTLTVSAAIAKHRRYAEDVLAMYFRSEAENEQEIHTLREQVEFLQMEDRNDRYEAVKRR